MNLASRQEMRRAAVSADNKFALVLRDRETGTYEVCTMQVLDGDRTETPQVRRLAAPPGAPVASKWSPSGDLFLCCQKSYYELVLCHD